MSSYYERNKERMLAYQRAYYQTHKENCSEYNKYYFQNVTRFVRETKPPREAIPRKTKSKTVITYNSGTVTQKRIRIRQPVEPYTPPTPGPSVFVNPGILLDWNKL